MSPNQFTKKQNKVEKITEEKVDKVLEQAQDKEKDFLSIEKPITHIDPLEVLGKNPRYEYRWCLKSKMAEGRFGHWVSVDRRHPDFKDIRVHADHSPDKSFFMYKDLILCCTRKETAQAYRQMQREKVKARTKAVTDNYEDKVGKVKRALGDRTEALSLMKSIDKEE